MIDIRRSQLHLPNAFKTANNTNNTKLRDASSV